MKFFGLITLILTIACSSTTGNNENSILGIWHTEVPAEQKYDDLSYRGYELNISKDKIVDSRLNYNWNSETNKYDFVNKDAESENISVYSYEHGYITVTTEENTQAILKAELYDEANKLKFFRGSLLESNSETLYATWDAKILSDDRFEKITMTFTENKKVITEEFENNISVRRDTTEFIVDGNELTYRDYTVEYEMINNKLYLTQLEDPLVLIKQ